MKLFVGIIVLFLTFSAYAVDKSSGCGAGWYVTKRNSLVSSTIRGTTNAIFFNATLGMTSGTMNCAKHSIVKSEKRGIHYAEANFHQLMVDMSRGEGEFLEGFAHVVGYSGDMKLFGGMVQQNFGNIFVNSDTTAQEMYENFKNVVI